MSSDSQFTAIGQAEVGFQTNSASIRRGAEIEGTDLGAHFKCHSADASGVAVRAEANAAPAIVAKSSLNDSIQARATAPNKCGINASGRPAVFGVGAGDRGGVFRSDPSGSFPRTAQINLFPNPAVPTGARGDFTPTAVQEGARLPKAGRAGDLFAFNEDDVCLFLCTTSSTPSQSAVWREVLLGPPTPGTD